MLIPKPEGLGQINGAACGVSIHVVLALWGLKASAFVKAVFYLELFFGLEILLAV